MKKLKKATISLLASAMFLSGCGVLTDPVSLIRSPQSVHAQDVDSQSLQTVASTLLPANATLVTSDLPIDSSPTKQHDFDQDGIYELLVTYEKKGYPSETQVMVLKEVENEWKKVWEQKGLGYKFTYVGFSDLTGDGQEELLIGWTIGLSAGNVLDVYTWEENSLNKLTSVPYHRFDLFEVIDPSKQAKQTRIATWQKDTGDAYGVEVLSWNGKEMVPDTESYHLYFPEVVTFYKGKVENSPDSGFYWYYLADAQLKSTYYADAIESAKKGIDLNSGYPDLTQFQQLFDEATKKHELSLSAPFVYQNEKFAFTFDFPKEWKDQSIIEENNEGSGENPILQVHHNVEGEKGLLFSVHIFPEYVWDEFQGMSLFKELGKRDGHVFAMLTSSEHPYAYQENTEQYNRYNSLFSQLNQITESFNANPPSIKKLDNEKINKFVQKALGSFYYVMSGGSGGNGEIETFIKDEMEYRYLSEDIGTREKLVSYLTKTFTKDAVNKFLKQSNIIDVNGRLAQPNADSGSLVNWGRASNDLIQDSDDRKTFRCVVPLGESFDTITVEIQFKKENDGWKLETNPFDLK